MLRLTCLGFVGLCAGQETFRKYFEQTIKTIKNKIVDLSEFEANFYQDDLNKDGKVALAEYLKPRGGMGPLVDPAKDGVIHKSELPVILHSFDLNDLQKGPRSAGFCW